MPTLNYSGLPAGRLVASGPGDATVTVLEDAGWAIGSSPSTAPDKSTLHAFEPRKDKSFTLVTGEHLYIYCPGTVEFAVTADNAASGDI